MPNWETVVDGEKADLNNYLDFRQYDTTAERDTASTSFGSLDLFKICRVVETGYYYYWNGAAWTKFPAAGGAGAPVGASYVTINAEGELTGETQHLNITGASLHVTKAHATEHESGGADDIKLDDLATPDDNVDLNASTTAHGLLKKLDNVGTNYMDGQGNWTAPPGGGAHVFAGAQHTVDTIADVNALISDATLDTSTGVCARSPPLHDLGTAHNADTIANLNAKISDATLADKTLTTQGDILYHGAAGLARLPVGAAGKYLKTQGAAADPMWDTPAGAGDMTKLAYDTTATNSKVDTALNAEKLNGQVAAFYAVAGHKNDHKTGGSDPFAVADLLDGVARVAVDKNSVLVGTRRNINLIEGSGISLTVTDDAANEEVDVNITATGAAASFRLAPSYTVYKAGATYYAMEGDGTVGYSDAKLAIVLYDAINNLTSGGWVHLQLVGTHTLEHDIFALQDHIKLTGLGKGVTILKIQDKKTSNLSGDAAANQKIIDVVDGTQFEEKQIVRLIDGANSEKSQIDTISGNQLTMRVNIHHAYTVAAGAHVDTSFGGLISLGGVPSNSFPGGAYDWYDLNGENWHVSHLTLDGNQSQYTYFDEDHYNAVMMRQTGRCDYVMFDNVEFQNVACMPIKAHNARGLNVTNCDFHDYEYWLLFYAGAEAKVTHNKFWNLRNGGAGGRFIEFEAYADGVIAFNDIDGTGNGGCWGITCYGWNAGDQEANVRIIGNHVTNTTLMSIRIGQAGETTQNVTCIGNNCDNDIEYHNLENSTIIGNKCAALTDNGGSSNNRIDQNVGRVNENSGSSTITNPATSQVVAHGLDVTPSAEHIHITFKENPTNAITAWWVDTIGAANFTVNVEPAPGASNLDFGWHVRVV